MEIKAGAGGIEADAWAGTLCCMYLAWALKRDPRVKMAWRGSEGWLSFDVGSEWGRLLDGESGIHRLIRCSPFDREGRRQTSFASVSIDGFYRDQQVRTYTLDPYRQVKDERSGFVVSEDPFGVLAGNLDDLLKDG